MYFYLDGKTKHAAQQRAPHEIEGEILYANRSKVHSRRKFVPFREDTNKKN